MTEQEKLQLYLQVSRSVEKDPEAIEWAIKGITDGLRIAAKQAREDQAGWEVIANMAMNKRLLDGHEMFIADKIEALKDRACFRWDWYVEKLKAIVAKKMEKKDET
jgi:hypothetical protein